MVERVDLPGGRPTETTEPAGIFKRISWGAIIAGALIALAVQFMLSLLGAGVGLGITSPAEGDSPQALGTGMAIWWIISTLIALFVGGWVASYLAGVFRKMDGALHGLVAWSLATVLGFLFMGTTLSALGGAAMGSRQGQGMLSSIEPAISQSMRQEGRLEDVRNDIHAQANRLVQQNAKPGADVKDAQEDITDALDKALDDPSQDNRQAAIKAFTDNSRVSGQDAQSRIDGWVRTFQQAKPEYREAGTPQAQKAEKAFSVASRTALATFVMLLLGAAAALLGGYVASPSDYWHEEHRDRGDRIDRRPTV